MEKRGFEMVWSTAFSMILGILLLIFLVHFFLTTSGNFSDRISQYLKKSNVDEVVASCNLMATSNQEYSYCCEPKLIKYFSSGKLVKENITCTNLNGKDFAKNLNEMDCVVTC